MNRLQRRDMILGKVRDLAVTFLAYDRKEDEDLPLGEIEKAVGEWDLTISEIALAFEEALRENIPVPASSEEPNDGKSWTPAEGKE